VPRSSLRVCLCCRTQSLPGATTSRLWQPLTVGQEPCRKVRAREASAHGYVIDLNPSLQPYCCLVSYLLCVGGQTGAGEVPFCFSKTLSVTIFFCNCCCLDSCLNVGKQGPVRFLSASPKLCQLQYMLHNCCCLDSCV
jgi:hypothetical protein